MSNLSPIQARRDMARYVESESVAVALKQALAEHRLPLQKFQLAVALEAMQEPKLALAIQQSPDTLAQALIVCAGHGLMPGRAHGQFYLIPRWSGRAQRTEVTFITGYKGLAQVAYRNRRVHKIDAHVVFRGEKFAYWPAESRIEHVWDPSKRVAEDGKTLGLESIEAAYAMATLTVPDGQHLDPTPLLCVMARSEILAIRGRSDGWKAFEAGKIRSTPWATDPIPMARKCPIRRMLGNGSIPADPDMVELLGAEAAEETRISAEGDREEAARDRGAAGLLEALGDDTVEPDAIDQVVAQLRELQVEGKIPDDIDPGMLSEQDARSMLERATNPEEEARE